MSQMPMIDTDSSQEAGTSTELTGGAGFTYEDTVVGCYLVALLQEASAAAGIDGTIVRVAVQQRPAGEPLDDVIVDARDAIGERRLSLQVKRTLRISAAVSNEDFREIPADCRATRAKPTFRVNRDTYGFVAESLLGPATDRPLNIQGGFMEFDDTLEPGVGNVGKVFSTSEGVAFARLLDGRIVRWDTDGGPELRRGSIVLFGNHDTWEILPDSAWSVSTAVALVEQVLDDGSVLVEHGVILQRIKNPDKMALWAKDTIEYDVDGVFR